MPSGGTSTRLYEWLSLHHSNGRAIVGQGGQVSAPAPVDGTEFFRMSDDGSDVQE